MITLKKKKNKVWVTFTLNADEKVSHVALCGEWNSWKEEAMKKKKNGDYSIRRLLPSGHSFEFGYKVNHQEWINDESCPKVASPYGSENSLLEL